MAWYELTSTIPNPTANLTLWTCDIFQAFSFPANRTGGILAGTYDISPASSGEIIDVDAANFTANVILVLPPVASSAGFYYRIKNEGTGGGTFHMTVETTDAEATIAGTIINGTPAVVSVAAHTEIVGSASQAIGDSLTFECDGIRWWVTAITSLAAGWTSPSLEAKKQKKVEIAKVST
jgi:hypothetical protein